MTNSGSQLDPILLLQDICEEWRARNARKVAFRGDMSALRGAGILLLTNRSVGTAQGFLTLIDQGFGVEVMPLLRAILEDAITVGWLLMDAKSDEIFVVEGAKKRKVILDAIGDNPDSDGYAQAVGILDDSAGVKVSTIEQRAATFLGGAELYNYYRMASFLTHSGIGVLDRFAETVEQEPGIAFKRDSSFPERESWAAVAAIYLLHSLCAADLAMRKPWRTTQLQKLCKKAQMENSVLYPDGSKLPDRD